MKDEIKEILEFDFERLQQGYSRGYFELYKKYFVEKENDKGE